MKCMGKRNMNGVWSSKKIWKWAKIGLRGEEKKTWQNLAASTNVVKNGMRKRKISMLDAACDEESNDSMYVANE